MFETKCCALSLFSEKVASLFSEGSEESGRYFKLISSCGSDGRAGTVPIAGTNPIASGRVNGMLKACY